MYLRSRSVGDFQPQGDIEQIEPDDVGEPAVQVEQNPFDTPPGSPGGGGFVPETPLSEVSEDMEIESTPVAMIRRGRIWRDPQGPSTPSIQEAQKRRKRRKRQIKKSPRITHRVSRRNMDHIRTIEGIPEAWRSTAEQQFLDYFT